MAVSLLAHEVSDLCLGKPALRPLSATATIAEALLALKTSEESFVSVWDCEHRSNQANGSDFDGFGCRCVGKLCMVDVIFYLCEDENLLEPSAALQASVSVILPKKQGIVMHLEPSASVLEAIDLILQGAQNLVVPIKTRQSSYARKKFHKKPNNNTIHNGWEFCWITQEDVIRFLLSSIGLFTPIPFLSIDTLDIITTDVLAIDYHSPASLSTGAISRSLADQTSLAVIDNDGILIGEISPSTLSACDKTVAAAIRTLSSGELMAYIGGGGPPEDLVRIVKTRLKEKNLEGMLEEFTTLTSAMTSAFSSSSSSSDEENGLSPTTTLHRSGRQRRNSRYSARMMKRAEAIVCQPRSSLVAVMIQAVAHRVCYVWVVEDDCSLVGIVTFRSMLKVFRQHLEAMA